MSISKKVLIPFLAVLLLGLSLFVFLETGSRTEYGKIDTMVFAILKYVEIKGIELFPPGETLDQSRERIARESAALQNKETVFSVNELLIEGSETEIPIRIYTPQGIGPFPIILFSHGGGWTIGGLDSHDVICRSLTNKTGSVVVSVDYRLAPEHPFPAGLTDVYDTLLWISNYGETIRGDSSKIIIAGDSAGANLAAALPYLSNEKNGPEIYKQILLYPVTDVSAMDTPSYGFFTEGYYLTKKYMEQFRSYYLPDPKEWSNPLASPLLAEKMGFLPPALVITAGFDVLRDEGEAYAEKMASAGVPVVQKRYPGMIHGFMGMNSLLKQADEAVDDIAAFLIN